MMCDCLVRSDGALAAGPTGPRWAQISDQLRSMKALQDIPSFFVYHGCQNILEEYLAHLLLTEEGKKSHIKVLLFIFSLK